MIRLLLILVLAASADAGGPPEFSARVWQSEDGLPGNVVRSLVQSSDGFLWVATAEGIVRFDGIEFESIAMPAERKWSRKGPNRLFATAGGLVWYSDHNGGLLRISEQRTDWVLDRSSTPRTPRVSQVIETADGLIVARRGTELWLLSKDPPTQLDPQSTEILAALENDLEQRNQNGRLLPDGSCGGLVDRSGHRWSTSGDKRLRATHANGSPVPIDLGEIDTSPSVTEMLEDTEGNVWAASPTTGLLRFRRRRATVIDESDGLSDSATLAVIEDGSAGMWVGSRSGGLDRLSDGRIEHFEFAPATAGPRRPVSALFLDRGGSLWASAREGSVFRWNGHAFDIAFPGQPRPTKVDAIHQDEDGVMWFGGTHGLTRVEDGTITQIDAPAAFPGGHVSAMTGGAEGRLWFGTTDGRVFREQDDRIHAVGTAEDLGRRRISCLLVEDSGNAWATTLGAGLALWNGSRWHRFGGSDGLPDQRLTSILPDNEGNLWLGSLGGVFRASQAELIARSHDPAAPLTWLRLDRWDGLPTRECTGSAQPSGWRTTDGRLWFPTARGLVAILPETIDSRSPPPPVFVREVRGGGTRVEPDHGRFTTGPGRTRLSFGYHGVNLSTPEKTSYRVRLKGLDESWQEAGPGRLSHYESVPPGVYHFEVLAVNGDGVPSGQAAVAAVIVRPHFWQTPWFIGATVAMLLLAAAGTGWSIARSRMKRRIRSLKLHHAREAERARIARDLHDDLGASVTEISLLAGLGAEQQDADGLRGSLEHIGAKSRLMVGSLDEIVWAVNPREDSVRSLVDYLTAFAREFLTPTGITLRLDLPRELPDQPMDSGTRHSLFLALREALNNLVKHSDANTARLAIATAGDRLSITLADDGRGLPEETGTGHGLANLRSRMQDCGGECRIEGSPGTGTSVRLQVPINER